MIVGIRRIFGSSLMILCFVLAACMLFPLSASANDIYLTQGGGGSGLSCSAPLPVAYFNTASNWGTAPGQIGPGTTIHLCGTFTGDTTNSMLIAQGSGSQGSPVTIKFETGAVLTSSAWTGAGAIHLDGHDHFVIDGGTPCGWVNMALVACNGVIENTLNGTPGTSCPGGTCSQRLTSSLAISASPANDVEIKNVAILDMYHVSGGEDVGGPPGPGCIHFYPGGSSTTVNIHNNIFTWAAWCLNGGVNNITIANNDFHFIDHGLGMGNNTDGTFSFSGISIHDNHYHDAYVWDSPSNDFHHDGFHIFAYAANGFQSNVNNIITGINIYNNLFDGDFGNNNTALIFFEGNEQNANIFNNVAIVAPGRQLNNGLYNGYGKNINTFNNTVLGPGFAFQTQKYSIFNGPNHVIKNNVYTDGGMISLLSPYPAGCPGQPLGGPCQTVSYVLSTNAYMAPADGANGFGSLQNSFYNFNAGGFASFEADSGETGGIYRNGIEPIGTWLNASTGAQITGSPTIGAGTNLTSFCTGLGIAGNPCLKDITGAPRPSTGKWDIGAYQVGTRSGQAPMAPTGLTASMH